MELEDLMLFPQIAAWLQELNAGPHGADGHNFAQYGEPLEQKMFKHIFQLETLTEDKLIAACNSMPPVMTCNMLTKTV